MPRRLGALLVFVGLSVVSGPVWAQASASFPDDDEEPPARPAPARPEPARSEPARPPPPVRPAVPARTPEDSSPRVAPSPPPTTPASDPPARSVVLPRPLPEPTFETSFRPPVLPAYPGMEPPPGYRAETRSNRGLAWGGGVTLAIGYAAGLGYGFSRDFEGGLGALAVPVLGPWLALTKREFDCGKLGSVDDAQSCQDSTFREAQTFAVLGTVGLIQAVGGTLFLVGLLDRRQEWVREDVGVANLGLRAVPLPGGGGAQLSGTF